MGWRRYPEVWLELGEARFHTGNELEMSPEAVLDAFNRAVALDSSFIPAYSGHASQMLVALGDIPALRRYAAAALVHQPRGSRDASSRELVAKLLDPDQAGSKASQQLLDTVPLDDLGTAFEWLEGLRDSAETAVRLARVFESRATAAGRAVADSFFSEPVGTRVARALAYRGHVHEAYANGIGHLEFFASLALLGVVPAESASRVFAHQLRTFHPESPAFAMLPAPWWALHGDTTSLREAIRRADSLGRPPVPPDRNQRWPYFANVGRAYLALARGDTSEAIRQFLMAPDSLCHECVIDQVVMARLLVARGRYREAAERLRTQLINPFVTANLVLLELERGRINEHLGDRETAIRAYRYVAEAWRRPDPELQPYASEAREALKRLGAGG